jgi:hypothetical protein
LNGERDRLSQRDLTFVGVDVWPITTPGWRSPVGLYLDDSLECFGLSPKDSAALHAIMSVGSQGRLDFLG